MKNKIVIGLVFGDEGKGLFVDYLSNLSSTIVRFSGGHQVGHTVVTDDVRHIFSNFGSGTLRGCPTYWSKYCTFEPIGFCNELTILKMNNIDPIIYFDKDVMITTPYDIKYNISKEKELKHGSVGVGFGATIERNENKYTLNFKDIFYPDIFNEKFRLVREYYRNKFNIDSIDPFIIDDFRESCHLSKEYEFYNELPINKNYIFEGTQGLMLDQNYGFFPNVTRSNTGTTNALEMMPDEEFEIYLITRAYQTRHGKGFMTNEHIPHNIKVNFNESNKTHESQGHFRRSILDLSLIEYAISKDKYINQSKNKNLVITCLDHIENEYKFTYKGEIITSKTKIEFIEKISNILKIKNIYISESSNSKNITKFNFKLRR